MPDTSSSNSVVLNTPLVNQPQTPSQSNTSASTQNLITATKPTTSNTPPNPSKQTVKIQSSSQNHISLHDVAHQPAHVHDDSFWTSLFTILVIPVLLLYALFEIVVKAAPWPTGF